MDLPRLDSTFIVLDSKLASTQVAVTPSLYEELDSRFDQFAGCMLVSQYTFSSDWPTWEVHPHGDEILYLCSGEATLHLHSQGVDRLIEFNTPGSFVVIPKGSWHTAKVSTSCTILFITPGEGTINRADPPSLND